MPGGVGAVCRSTRDGRDKEANSAIAPLQAQPMTESSTQERVGCSEILTREHVPALILVCFGIWLHAADSLLVATMLPTIITDIGGDSLASWAFALYEVGSIVTGAASGLLATKLGIRRPMIIAATAFALGCFVSALAPNMVVMLLGRALQGAGGGGLVAFAFIAVAVLFPTRLVVRAMAAVAMLWGIAAFLGPLFGSLFVTYSDWRIGFAFFGAKACFLVVWIIFGPQIVERTPIEQTTQRFPVWRLMLLCVAILLVAFSGIEIHPVRTPFLAAAGVAALAFFVILDGRRRSNRLLPARVHDLRRPENLTLCLILLLHLSTTGLITYGPFLLIAIHGATAVTAGYAIACISVGWTVAAVAVSGVPESRDLRFITIGVLMVVCSVPGLLFSVQFGPIWLIFIFAALEGAGQGASRAFLVRRALMHAGPDDRERISGAMPTISRIGYALGATISGILANSADFTVRADAEQAARFASYIFMGSLPFAALAAIALIVLVVTLSRTPAKMSEPV